MIPPVNGFERFVQPDGRLTPAGMILLQEMVKAIGTGGGGGGSWPVSGTPAAILGTTASFTIAKDAKLTGIAIGATANDTDANLRDRATHTGTQAISTITGLTAALPLSGVATVTVPNGRIEWTETVSATGLTAGRRVVASIGSHVDADENDPELLDVMALSARAGTDSLTVTLAFGQPVAGPVKVEWVAHG